MIIDIALLLDLADHRATALRTGDQTRKSEVVPAALGLIGEPGVENALNALP